METGGGGGPNQNNLMGVRTVDQPRSSPTFVNLPQKRPNPASNNNGVTYKRSVPSAVGFGSTSPKITVQPSSSTGVPKNRCKYCNKPFVRDSGQNFCSPQCANNDAVQKEHVAISQNFLLPVRATPSNRGHVNQPARTTAKDLRMHIKAMQQKESVQEDHDGESSRSSVAEDFRGSSSSASNSVQDFYLPPRKKKKKDPDASFEWLGLIKDPDFKAASVSLVKHAPLARMWDNVTVGMKLEVENTDVDDILMEKAFWVASVVKIQGYYVLLRYEGFGNDTTGDFWINLCSPSVHHVGWCANKGKPLIPPKSIARKFTDWRNFLVNRLTGARTLPLNFLGKIAHGIQSQNQLEDTLEVVDKNRISQLRVAFVKEIVGRRLHVEYFDNEEDGGFWCHEESRLIHPSGWAKTIGHKILQPPDYDPPLLASTPYDAEYETMELEVGMKLEAIDPLNLSAICAATIKQVLGRGYVMVRVDCYEEDSGGSDWFCYHISSPYVYNCGYCASNGITLTPPTGYDKATFTWDEYFQTTNAKPAPVKIKKVLNHKFMVGMKVEVADLMDPRLICVATICQVVGRLLKIHFDGWEEEYDQWMDARSPDIYPIGWCEIVKHRLEPPRPPIPIQKPPAAKKAKKGKKKAGVRGGAKASLKSKTSVKVGNANVKVSAEVKLKASDMKPKPKLLDVKPVAANRSIINSMKHATATSETVVQRNNVPNFPPQKPKVKTELKTKPGTSTADSPRPQLTTSIIMSNVRSCASNGGSEKKPEVSRSVPSTLNKIGHEASTSKIAARIPKSSEDPVGEKPVEPTTWSIEDVADFLKRNDCGPYCDSFTENGINGEKFLALTKDEILKYTGMKVGPTVKIFELISQLKKLASASAAKARNIALSK